MDPRKIVPFPRRRRAPRCSPAVTEEMASKIKTLVIIRGHAQHVVAAMFKINQGRVSDIINGRIFPNAPFAPVADVI